MEPFRKWVRVGLLSILLNFIGIASSISVDLSSANFRYKYDPECEVRIQHQLEFAAEMYQVHFKIILKEDSITDYTFEVFTQAGYIDNSAEAASGEAISPNSRKGNTHFFSHQFPDDSSLNLIVLAVSNPDLEQPYYYDIPIGIIVNFQPPGFLLSKNGALLYEEFVQENDSIAADKTVWAYQYPDIFPAALPPIAEPTTVPENLQIQSVRQMNRGLKIENDKFYFIQSDTVSFSGRTVIGAPQFYPRLAKIENVVEPLIYISTKSEFDQVVNSADLKKGFDAFWLNVVGSKTKAAQMIRYFFRQVAFSNQYFTNYKQGWKTDMGMVFIIFGVPDLVKRTAATETWYYNDGLNESSTVFTFHKIKNIFTPHHYELERSDAIKQAWFQQVNRWRKGRI
ncbi:MAG: GWxTD domain-containing protein [Cyclobacteriaceae bacterium]